MEDKKVVGRKVDNENDVVWGCGHRTQTDGTKNYNDLVAKHALRYNAAEKGEKRIIAEELVAGFSFVHTRNDRVCKEVRNEDAVKKTMSNLHNARGTIVHSAPSNTGVSCNEARELRRSRIRRGRRRRSSMGAPTPASSSNESTKIEDVIEIDSSFSSLSSVEQTHEKLLSEEAEVACLTGQLSNLQKETPRLRELKILLEASEDKNKELKIVLEASEDKNKELEIVLEASKLENKELADRHGAEKNAREDSERRCLEVEQQLKAADKKTKEIANERTCDRMATEARCLELESRLKASHEKKQELAALLRQSMDQSLDGTEALREMAQEYDYAVQSDQLEKKVSATILANEELAREKEFLSGEISELKTRIFKLNTSIFDAEPEREVQAEEIQIAQKQIQSLVTQCQSFEIESNTLKQTNMTVTEEKKSLTKKISENKVIIEQYKSLKTTLNGVKDTNLVITEEKKSLTKRFTELNASILRSEQKHKAQTTELEHVQNQNKLLADRCKLLEAELNYTTSLDVV